jgi:SAM-dependent methyltransferase
VPVDIVDDGERLTTIADASQDFVVANHFLEHCQDPIGTLLTFLRVLRPGGVLFLAVPDKRFTFDRDRPVTPLAHLVRDHEQGPEWSRRGHFEEWARLVNKVPEERLQRRVEHLIATDRSIHYHVCTPTELLDLLVWLGRERALPIDVELFTRRGDEMIVVLRKRGGAASDPAHDPSGPAG